MRANLEKREQNRRDLARRRAWIQRLAIAIGLAVITAVVLGVLAANANATSEMRRRAQAAQSLAANAEIQLDRGSELGLLLAMKSVSKTLEARDPVVPAAFTALHQALLDSPLKYLELVKPMDTGDLILQATNSTEFSPDGKRILVAQGTAGVYEFNSSSGAIVHSFENQTRDNLAHYSPDGSRVVIVGDGVTIWDASTAITLSTLPIENDPLNASDVASFRYSNDGRLLVCIRYLDDGTEDFSPMIEVWDPEGGMPLKQWPIHRSERSAFSPTDAEFSRNDKYLLLSDFRKFRILDANTGEILLYMNAFALEFTPDGEHVAVFPDGDTFKIIEIRTNREISYSRDFPHPWTSCVSVVMVVAFVGFHNSEGGSSDPYVMVSPDGRWRENNWGWSYEFRVPGFKGIPVLYQSLSRDGRKSSLHRTLPADLDFLAITDINGAYETANPRYSALWGFICLLPEVSYISTAVLSIPARSAHTYYSVRDR